MRNRAYRLAKTSSVPSAVACTLCLTASTVIAQNSLDPAVINAGPFALTPTLGFETKHRDNIYLQQRNPTDSWISLERPELNAALQDRENLYQLNYKGEAAQYEVSSNNDRNDYFDNTFSSNAHVELSDRWIAAGNASWAALHEDRGTGLSEGLVGQVLPEPVRYDQSDVGGSLQYGTQGVARLLVRAGYMDREYQNFKEITRSRDRDESTLGSTFFYPIAPKTSLLADYTYKHIHYPNPFTSVPELDSDENSLLVGARWEITPNLVSTAKAGYVDKNFDSSQRADWNGLGWSVDLLMQPRQQDSIVVQSSRAPEETTLQGDFIKRSAISTVWTHYWSDRVYTELGGLYGQDVYEQSIDDRKENIYNASIRVGYLFRRWVNIYAGYRYDDKGSNAPNLSYTDNVFNVGVDLSL
jgi:hypothetical protein